MCPITYNTYTLHMQIHTRINFYILILEIPISEIFPFSIVEAKKHWNYHTWEYIYKQKIVCLFNSGVGLFLSY